MVIMRNIYIIFAVEFKSQRCHKLIDSAEYIIKHMRFEFFFEATHAFLVDNRSVWHKYPG